MKSLILSALLVSTSAFANPRVSAQLNCVMTSQSEGTRIETRIVSDASTNTLRIIDVTNNGVLVSGPALISMRMGSLVSLKSALVTREIDYKLALTSGGVTNVTQGTLDLKHAVSGNDVFTVHCGR